MNIREDRQTVLVHLASGIGNIVLATPLLIALNHLKFIVDVLMHADYPQTADLLRDWSIVREVFATGSKEIIDRGYNFIIPAIPPFYWSRFAHFYTNVARIIRRPPDSLFYRDEQEYYLSFARALGYPIDCKPFYGLPISPSESFGLRAKRWSLPQAAKPARWLPNGGPIILNLPKGLEM